MSDSKPKYNRNCINLQKMHRLCPVLGTGIDEESALLFYLPSLSQFNFPVNTKVFLLRSGHRY